MMAQAWGKIAIHRTLARGAARDPERDRGAHGSDT